MTSLWEQKRGTIWTLGLILVTYHSLMVSSSSKVKDKRMVNFFLASVPFWIYERGQEGVIHNPWPMILLKASWAKVTNGKKEW